MTDVTKEQEQASAELPAADGQLLRELTERARAGGLKRFGMPAIGGISTDAVAGELDGGASLEEVADDFGRDYLDLPRLACAGIPHLA